MRSPGSRDCLAIALVVVLLAASSASTAQEAPPTPRVALALSGGGARGVAHIGALRALEEAGIPVDAVAANSMGAVVGGIYATGRGARELEASVRSLDWVSLFSGRSDRRTLPISRRQDRYGSLAGVSLDWGRVRLPAGLIAEHRVNRFLIQNLAPASYAAGGDFDRLPVPFRAVATDLGDGEPVVLAQGDLARAVRASMSIPLAFPPVDWHGRRLVDGLVVNNLPIDVAKGWKPAVLVAVDIASPDLEPSDYETALGVATRVNDLLTSRRNRDFQAAADVLVRPDLGRHSATDYSGFDELIRRGYEATRAAVPQIREKLAAAGVTDLGRRPADGRRALEGPRSARWPCAATCGSSDRWLLHVQHPGGPGFDMERGLRAFDKIGASGLLDRTWMEFEPLADGVRRRAPREGSAAEPRRGGARLHGVGEGARPCACATRTARLRRAARAASRRERRRVAGDARPASERACSSRSATRLRGYAITDKPRFFDAEGEEVNRATFERSGARACAAGPARALAGSSRRGCGWAG